MTTIAEIIAELDREIAVRRRLFPDWVWHGRLTQAQADHRIECLVAARDMIKREICGDLFKP